MVKHYFDELRQLYDEFKKNYKERVEVRRNLMKTQIKTKGRKYNVLPYQEERMGRKLNGKVVDEIEMKDNNCIYYFDDEGRVGLVEEASTFLKGCINSNITIMLKTKFIHIVVK